MARRKLINTYENQSKLSVLLAIVGALGTVGAAGLLARNFTDLETFWVAYRPSSMWLPAMGGSLLLALIASGIGFLVGFGSAGQRRNTLSGVAWLGFFLNAGVLVLALCAAVFFYFTRHKIEF